MSRRGRKGHWIEPARRVLEEARKPLHSNAIRQGIEDADVEGATDLAGTTLYTSMLQSREFVRVAGRPSVFGLSEWYAPTAVLSRFEDLLSDPAPPRDFFIMGVPRASDLGHALGLLDCVELAPVVRKTHGALTRTSASGRVELVDSDTIDSLRLMVGQIVPLCPELADELRAIESILTLGTGVGEERESSREGEAPEALSLSDAEWQSVREVLRGDFVAEADEMISGFRQEIGEQVISIQTELSGQIGHAKEEIAGASREAIEEVRRIQREMSSEFTVHLRLLPGEIQRQLFALIVGVLLLGIVVGVMSSLAYDSWKQSVVNAEIRATGTQDEGADDSRPD